MGPFVTGEYSRKVITVSIKSSKVITITSIIATTSDGTSNGFAAFCGTPPFTVSDKQTFPIIVYFVAGNPGKYETIITIKSNSDTPVIKIPISAYVYQNGADLI